MDLRREGHNIPLGPFIDPDNFNAGYLQRALPILPQPGDKPEWQHTQDYCAEKDEFPNIDLDGGPPKPWRRWEGRMSVSPRQLCSRRAMYSSSGQTLIPGFAGTSPRGRRHG